METKDIIILVVAKHESWRIGLGRFLEIIGYKNVFLAGDKESIVSILSKQKIGAVFYSLAYSLSDNNEMLRAIEQGSTEPPVVIVVGSDSEASLSEIKFEPKPDGYLHLLSNFEELINEINRLLPK